MAGNDGIDGIDGATGPTLGWPASLALDPTSGVNNPRVIAGQYLGFGTTPSGIASGQIRSNGAFEIRGDGNVTLTHGASSFVGISGFLKYLTAQAAALAGLTTGQALTWLKNTTPGQLWFTDDANQSWRLGATGQQSNGTILSASNATTILNAFGNFPLAANSLAVGSQFEVEIFYVYTRGATATAHNLIVDFRFNSPSAAVILVPLTTVAGTYAGTIKGILNILSIGATGTLVANIIIPPSAAVPSAPTGTTNAAASLTVDTTAADNISCRIAMDAAVAGTTLSMVHAHIKKVN